VATAHGRNGIGVRCLRSFGKTLFEVGRDDEELLLDEDGSGDEAVGCSQLARRSG
jgi:hypothetical protein